MKRTLPDFITSYLEYTTAQESPEQFHLWMGLGLVSACLGQRTWINRSQYKIYPNAYIILVSDSGICRKSTAVSMARDLLFGMDGQGPLLMPQRATPEVMIKLLKDNIQIDPLSKRRISGGVIVASELDSMFAGDEARKNHMLTLLTDLYDVPKVFSSATITRKEESLPYPCMTLLGASTMEWLRGIVGERGLSGGFASRVYFVHAETSNRFIPHPTKDAKLRETLVRELIEISEYRGAWEIDPDAMGWFEAYYKECYIQASNCEPAFRGYASRKADHMLRVAMLLEASAGTQGYKIGQTAMEAAGQIVDSLEESLESIYQDLATSGDGALRRDVMDFIKAREGGCLRTVILRRFHRKLNARKLDEILETLEGAAMIDRVVEKGGGQRLRERKEKSK